MENKKKKCTSKNHGEIEANTFCQECRIYMCNKCEKIHSDLCQNHHIYNLDKDIKEIFTGFCKEENHLEKLKFFCKNHNQLCCSSCIIKIKREGDGQHAGCTVCNIEDIENEKKLKLKDNIKSLEDLSQNLQQNINELKEIMEKINDDKEKLKTQIQNIFTKIRNCLNDREDYLLKEVEKQFNSQFCEESLIKEIEKLPNKIKLSLEKGKLIEIKWKENELNSLIDDCINIEKNINIISTINGKQHKLKSNKIIINFEPEEKGLNSFIKQINEFGELKVINPNKLYSFSFKDCPNSIKEDRKYIVSGQKKNIVTKTGKDGVCMGTICEGQLENNKVYTWKVKILKTKEYKIDVGVAPIDFDINSSMYNNCGWYLYCYNLTLDSGPPHKFSGKSTNLSGDRNEIKIVMNMEKRTLKFILNNEDKGESFINIPIDKPLTPAVCLESRDDSVEIISC